MPFIPGTPESLLPRSDSKNPASTCNGLTSNGRPCRRSLSRTPQSSPNPSPRRGQNSEVPYCWQHQDQANAQGPSQQARRPHAIRERSSVDTLVDRLGLLEVEQRKGRKHHRNTAPHLETEKPSSRAEVSPPSPVRPTPQPKPRSNLAILCCIGVADDSKRAPRPRPATSAPAQSRVKVPVKGPQGGFLQRPPINRDPSSQTTRDFLSLIPKSAAPQTVSLLLAELAKPISEQDKEGYIYMFWLTPESLPSEPPARAASSLLDIPQPTRPAPGHRRTSDVLNSFTATPPDASKKTMLLKIGRAANVQKRMQQWTKQCGYNLSVIRVYPYVDTNSAQAPRTVPNANKVERLIHLELNAMRVKGNEKCASCGTQHREWFEVDASREGVRAVDEVIRRWTDWGEKNPRI